MVIAIQIFGVLLILFNFFVLFMCAKRWRIVHVMFTFLTFAVSILFIFLTSLSLKTRVEWQKAVAARELDVEKVEQEISDLKFGPLDKQAEAEESMIAGAKVAIEREQYDRGRIWNGCIMSGADANSVTVTTFTPDPAAAADAPVRANKMTEKMTLYAFKEREANAGDGFKVPYQYLGEFVATAVTETSVTLTPSLPLDDVQRAAINATDTWALYEVMPVDSHEAFAGFNRETLKLILGTDEKKVLDQYAYDLMPIREIQALDKDFEPGPERVWFKVKFLKAHTMEVDSKDAPIANATLFDAQGRALPLTLRQGGDTSFEIGEFAIFHQDSDLESNKILTQMLADGICEKVDEIYVRPLQNYEHHFHEIDKRFRALADRLAVVVVDTANVKAGHAAAIQQAEYRSKELENLRADHKGVQFELAEITAYREKLDAELAQKRAELSDLYRTNNALVARLAELQRQIADELNSPASTPDLVPISTTAP